MFSRWLSSDKKNLMNILKSEINKLNVKFIQNMWMVFHLEPDWFISRLLKNHAMAERRNSLGVRMEIHQKTSNGKYRANFLQNLSDYYVLKKTELVNIPTFVFLSYVLYVATLCTLHCRLHFSMK